MGLRHRAGIEGGCFFVTTTVVGHIPVFRYPELAEAAIGSLKHYQERYGFGIDIYVLMPSHLHLIMVLPEKVALSAVMRDFKKFTSVQLKRIIAGNCGYDRIAGELSRYVPKRPDRSFRLWESRFDDVSLYTQKKYDIKFNYILNNPVKAGLCRVPEEYPWSSFYRPDGVRSSF